MWNNLRKLFDNLGEEMVNNYKNYLLKKDPFETKATGELFNNVRYDVKYKPLEIILYFQAPTKYFDPNTNETYIDQGRNAGSAPEVKVIKQWLIDRESNWVDRGYPGGPNPYAIQQGIYIHGIPPKNYLKRSIDPLREGLSQKIEQAIKMDLIEEIMK